MVAVWVGIGVGGVAYYATNDEDYVNIGAQ